MSEEQNEEKPKGNALTTVIWEVMPAFERIATRNNMVTWAEESQFAIQAIMKNPMLQKCTRETLQDAVINVAAVGLTLNPADGYAYLVPEYNKTVKRTECQLRVSFRGLLKVATDTGAIAWVKAEVVKENDTFEYRGVNQMPMHHMDPFRPDRGETIGVYCVARTNSGDFLVDTISRAEIDLIRKCAKTDNVWRQWFDEMAKKSVIKRAAKQWPKTQKSSVLHKTIEVINDTEGSDYDDFGTIQKIAAALMEKIEAEDQLAVGEIWAETTDNEKSALWVAVTKGGFFSQKQKDFIRESVTAWHAANKEAEAENSADPEGSVIEGEIEEKENASNS